MTNSRVTMRVRFGAVVGVLIVSAFALPAYATGQSDTATAKSATGVLKVSAAAPTSSQTNASSNADANREFWPFLILGRRLKVTDSLLTAFTFLLIVIGAGTVWYMHASAQREQRAYLGFSHRWIGGKRNKDGRLETEQLEIQPESENRESYKTGVYVSNHGRTPAEVYFKGACGVLRHPAPRNAIEQALNEATGTRYDWVAKLGNPGMELPLYYELRSGGPCSKPEADERIYAFGTVLYKDVFGKWHFNNVCTFHNPDSTTGSTWVTAGHFNDAGNLRKLEMKRRFAELWPPRSEKG